LYDAIQHIGSLKPNFTAVMLKQLDLGEHTTAILAQLGYDPNAIAALRETNCVK
jgi:crotonobetainyl-CoA:carnitine CoA-transferase CaiB-like acyl-CoA transferase